MLLTNRADIFFAPHTNHDLLQKVLLATTTPGKIIWLYSFILKTLIYNSIEPIINQKWLLLGPRFLKLGVKIPSY